MKKILIALIFLTNIAFSQSVNRQNIGLSIGASFPLSDFSKTILSDSTSGFAKTGVALAFNYSYRVTHNFGFQMIINYSSNAIDNMEYRRALELEHPDYGVSVESTKNWNTGGLFIGPFLTLPLNSKLSWDFRGLGGFFGAYSPNATIHATNFENPNDKKEMIIETSRASNFAYMLGSGFKYKVTSSTNILIFGDYVGSSLKFKDSTGWDWDDEPFVTDFNQKINYFTVTIGLSYIL